LTAEEIKAYYRCPPVPGDTDLYAYFKLDDASGSVYYSGSNPSIQMEFTGTCSASTLLYIFRMEP
jgi:hypothetical protein